MDSRSSSNRKRKPKRFRKCEVCGDKFDRKGTRKQICEDSRCKDVHEKRERQKRYLYRKGMLMDILKQGCYFEYLNACTGKLNCHLRDGTLFKEITGYDQSTIMTMKDSDFNTICADKDLRVFCDKHLHMVLHKENEIKSDPLKSDFDKEYAWEDTVLYIVDKEMSSMSSASRRTGCV